MTIRGLGVIDEAVLQLAPGLNVVTGETGAGKTMVVTGLGLLLGGRSDSDLVRTGAERISVEGFVELPPDHPALERAGDAGADVDDGLILARTVATSGRSRAHLGGRSVPVSTLAEVGEQLVAVHGQADQWRLRSGEEHRVVLDAYDAQIAPLLAAFQQTYDEHHRLAAELDGLRSAARERAREADGLRVALEEIEAADPQPGEDDELRLEDDRLSHADALRDGAARAHAALAGDEQGWEGPATGAVAAMAEAATSLEPWVAHDPALADLHRRLSELSYLAADLTTDLAGYLTDVEVDPARLAAVQDRRADLVRLQRKYGDTIDEVLAWAQQASTTLLTLEGDDARIAEIEHRLQEITPRLGQQGAQLHDARTAAAARLGEAVTRELTRLSMPRATLVVHVTTHAHDRGLELPTGERVRYSRNGIDEVEIALAANAGAPPRSVTKAASGGELSRVMLALEVVARGGSSVPTFVFDEVDAGIGGKAGVEVGGRLAELARSAQVIVVTHLAQVAAYADRHLVVRKADDGQVAASGVVEVSGEERVRELARMMSGDDSAAAVEHAQQLLDTARRGRARRR
ncbi:DNA repair protein RecN [Arsenicicoccus sp. oral taxon 190]|uniref:DNA repair protein RecN n=1 Tax=Arsenicicoccus sp. oral taxon 190 TaxID=1658671 RepID=UPI0020A20E25|nr:DNA repair protein RecN [Arsenicicoccus sp. oral taxon 190]